MDFGVEFKLSGRVFGERFPDSSKELLSSGA